jgi:hypothetical protein
MVKEPGKADLRVMYTISGGEDCHIFLRNFCRYNLLFSPSRVIYTHAERHRTPAREDKAMTTYKTNHATTTKSMTEWYFGKAFVAA